MSTSSKFIVATHILTSLAGKREYFSEGTVTKSEILAESVNTNPVVIRRLIGILSKAGLIISKSGPNGGAILAEEPDKITLDMIYKAVETHNELFHFHYQNPSDKCPIGANIQQVLSSKLKKMNQIIIDYLSTISLKEILDETLQLSGILKYMENGLSAEQIEEMIFRGEIEVSRS